MHIKILHSEVSDLALNFLHSSETFRTLDDIYPVLISNERGDCINNDNYLS